MAYKKFIASADSQLWETNPTTNYGTVDNLGINKVSSVGGRLRSVVKFDLSSIRADATIDEAILTLVKRGTGGSGEVNDINRLVRDWAETETTWNEAETGTNWGTAGAENTTSDYNSTVIDTITSPSSQDTEATADITSLVQDWIDGTSPNYGLIVRPTTNDNPNIWHSSEATSEAFRPYLEVWYTHAAITYALNGTTISGGVQSDWKEIEVGLKASGARRIHTWLKHVWTIPETDVSSYGALIAARGSSLTSLATNDYSDRNGAATYTTGRVMRVAGRPVGHKVTNVTVEFLIDPS